MILVVGSLVGRGPWSWPSGFCKAITSCLVTFGMFARTHATCYYLEPSGSGTDVEIHPKHSTNLANLYLKLTHITKDC